MEVFAMGLMRHTSLIFAVSSLLTACGGGETTISPDWETKITPATTVQAFAIRHNDIAVDAFGDLVSVGEASSDADPTTSEYDVFNQLVITKQSPDGAEIWQSVLNYPNGTTGSAYEIESDQDGNLYVVGDGFIIKTDPFGQKQWEDTLDGLALSVTLTNDRVYVPGKITRIYDHDGNLQLPIDNGGIYPWEVKIAANGDIIQATRNAITRHDTLGNLIWSAPAPADVTTVGKIQLDAAENIYVSYLSNDGAPSGNKAAARLIKVSNTGQVIWNQFIPDRRRSSNYFKSGMVQLFTATNGELVNITSGSKGRQITRLNPDNGQVIWEKVHTGQGRADEVHMDALGNLYIAGSNNPQKFDANGNLVATGEMPYAGPRNSLAVIGNKMFVGGALKDSDEIWKFYTVAFSDQ